MALALQAVQNIADCAPVAWLKAVDVTLVLNCAREAPDTAVRNAALTLLEVLARKLPDIALKHVLEVSPHFMRKLLCCRDLLHVSPWLALARLGSPGL